MADLNEPIVAPSTQPDEPDNRQYEPKTRSMVWWSLGGLAVVGIVVGAIYDMGSRTRTTAPATTTGSSASTVVPMGPDMPGPGR